jgi:hypothetical protein
MKNCASMKNSNLFLKNQGNMKGLFTTVLIMILLSCEKGKIKIVPKQYSWSLDSAFFGDSKIILGSKSLGNNLLAVTTPGRICLRNGNEPGTSISCSLIRGITNPLSPTIGIGDYVSAYKRDDELGLFSTKEPLTYYGTYRPIYSASTTSLKRLVAPDYGSGYSIINSKYILAPFEVSMDEALCALIEIDSANFFTYDVRGYNVVPKKIIMLSPSSSIFGSGFFSATYFNKFFINLGGQFYRIDTNGDVKPFGSPTYVNKMFSINDYLFALGGDKIKIIVSKNRGEEWSYFNPTQNNSAFSLLNYVNIEGFLYAFFESQLFKITMSINNGNGALSLLVTELDNDGLESNKITTISKSGKYAYVGTYSGLFYRDTAKFNTPKKSIK